MIIDQRYLEVLRKLYAGLADSDVNWVVTGSLALALQGVPVQVHDIDIQTDADGAYEIERLFSEFISRKVSFSTAERIRSHYGALMMDGIEVEIMGDIQKRMPDGSWEEPVDIDRHKTFVEVDGMQVPVLTLEYEYQAYRHLGRADKVEILKRWLCKGGAMAQDNSQPDLIGKAVELARLVDYQEGSVVSRTIIDAKTGTVTLFAFAQGQGLSEHTAPFDALVYVLDGEAEITISGRAHSVRAGEMLIMPTNEPHALQAIKPFKMLLVMIRS